MLTELSAGTIRPFIFYEGEFDTATVRFTTHAYDLTWNASTWLANGFLIDFSDVQENNELRADSMSITLNGIPNSVVALLLNDTDNQQRGYLYLGMLTSSLQIVPNPVRIFSGMLDSIEIEDSPEGVIATINYENRLADLQRPRQFRYTDATQQSLYSGDLGFQYVNQLQDWTAFWGRPKSEKTKKDSKKKKK